MMVEKLNRMKPEVNMDDVANPVFKEMLGHRLGYVGVLGHLLYQNHLH